MQYPNVGIQMESGVVPTFVRIKRTKKAHNVMRITATTCNRHSNRRGLRLKGTHNQCHAHITSRIFKLK